MITTGKNWCTGKQNPKMQIIVSLAERGDPAARRTTKMTTFFLKYEGETKKVSDRQLSSLDDLLAIVSEKFSNAQDTELAFYTADRQYGVTHKLEDASEVYDGCVVDVVPVAAGGSSSTDDDKDRLKQELENMKKRLQDIEGGSNHTREREKEAPSGKRQRTVQPAVEDDGKHWVLMRGLPWEAKKEDVIKFFEGLEMEDDSVFLVMNQNGQATGEAYIQMKDEESVNGAVTRSNKHIGRRYIEVYKTTQAHKDQAVSRSRPKTASVDSQAHVVKVRGLSFGATEQDLRTFFNNEPSAVHLLTDHLGRTSGDAFVEFSSESQVAEAMKKNKEHLGRRYLDLYISTASEANSALSARSGPVMPKPTSIVVKLRGLPFDATEQMIRDFFKNIPVGTVHMIKEGTRAKGEAYVEFDTEDAASEAMKLNKEHIGRRYIDLYRSSVNELVVALAFGSGGGGGGGGAFPPYNPASTYGNMGMRGAAVNPYAAVAAAYGSGGGGGGGSQGGYGGGYSSGGYSSGGRGGGQGVDTHCLRMKGIPFSATEPDITRFFHDGRVNPIRMHRKQNGGEAFVEFANEHEAKVALQLNKTYLGNRYIDLIPVSYEEMASVVGLPVPTANYGYSGYRH